MRAGNCDVRVSGESDANWARHDHGESRILDSGFGIRELKS
jgi:hypothetical protein